MAKVWLVRHAEAAAGWGDDADPLLSDRGVEQAEALARRLAPLGPMPVISSPLRRCLATATPLAARWRVEPDIDELVGEIPSPSDDLHERSDWLREAMAGAWHQLGADQQAWRQSAVQRVGAIRTDCVVITHFVLCNAVVGHASGDPQVLCYAPANAAVTVVRTGSVGGIEVLTRGEEMRSRVL